MPRTCPTTSCTASIPARSAFSVSFGSLYSERLLALAYTALILLEPFPGTVTHRSRGMLTRVVVLLSGSMLATIIVSVRSAPACPTPPLPSSNMLTRPSPSPFNSSGLKLLAKAGAMPPPLKTLLTLIRPLNSKNPPVNRVRTTSAKPDRNPHFRIVRQRLCRGPVLAARLDFFSLNMAPLFGKVMCSSDACWAASSFLEGITAWAGAEVRTLPWGCRPSGRRKSSKRLPLGRKPSVRNGCSCCNFCKGRRTCAEPPGTIPSIARG